MTFDQLKSEALKLPRVELFGFIQSILQSLQEEDTATPEWLQKEVLARAEELHSGRMEAMDGHQAHRMIIERHGLSLSASPTSI